MKQLYSARIAITSIGLSFVFVHLGAFPALAKPKSIPDSYTKKVATFPDLTQKLNRFGHNVDDGYYCAPVSASNGIIWLSQNGYPKLARGYQGAQNQQAHFAVLLGGRRYMNTRKANGGTSVNGFMRGLYRYVLDCGYKPTYFKYQGWRRHPKAFSTGKRIPELDWMKRGVIGNSIECLNVGFYNFDERSRLYKRVGGHWVTLVGYGVNRKGGKDPGNLLIHDPAPRDGMTKKTDFVRIHKIRNCFMKPKRGKSFSAKGYYMVLSGLKIRKKRIGIIDGAVVMRF